MSILKNPKALSNEAKLLVKNLQSKRSGFFCGAGVSWNSGVPSVSMIISRILQSLLPSEKSRILVLEEYKRSRIPFERIIENILEVTNDQSLFEIFNYSLPNSNHYFLAHLAKKGTIKEIYTTNFDVLIEIAFKNLGLVENIHYKRYITEKDFTDLRKEKGNSKIKLIKIHGSIDNPQSIITTLKSVAQNKLFSTRARLIEDIFWGPNLKNIIFLGYSFSDVFDVNKVLDTISKKSSRNLYIINHTENFHSCKIQSLQKTPYNKYIFRSHSGKIISCKTDRLISTLWPNFIDVPYEPLNFRSTWYNRIDKWYARQLPGVSELICSHLCFIMGLHRLSLKYVDMSIGISEERKLKLLHIQGLLHKATILHREGGKNIDEVEKIATNSYGRSVKLRYYAGIGRSLHLLGLVELITKNNYNKSRKHFEGARKAYSRIDDVAGVSKENLQLGSVYRRLKEWKLAESSYNQVLKERMELGDMEGIAKCNQGLGNVFLQKGNLSKAQAKYKELLKIAKSLGNEWLIATGHYCVATSLFIQDSKKHFKIISEHIDKSVKVRKKRKNEEYYDALFLKAQLLFDNATTKKAKAYAMKMHRLVLANRIAPEQIFESELMLKISCLDIQPVQKRLKELSILINERQDQFPIHFKQNILGRLKAIKIKMSNQKLRKELELIISNIRKY